MKGNAVRNETVARREAIALTLNQTEGISDIGVFSRIKIAMTKERIGDPLKVSLVLICQWLKNNDLKSFLSSDELIDIVAKDTKLNRSIVKHLFKDIPFKIPPHLKPVKIKKVKNKKKPSMVIVSQEKPELISTLEVTVPPRELAYFSKQDQVALQNKVKSENNITLTPAVQNLFNKYKEQIDFVVSQLKGDTAETVAKKIFNSLNALKIENGKPQDTPLFKVARWLVDNKENLFATNKSLVVNISKGTGLTQGRVRKLLIKYDFDIPSFDVPKEDALQEVEVKEAAEVKSESFSEKPQPVKITPSISTEDGSWIETHIGAKVEQEKEKIEKIELDPSVKKQYILSGPGIEIIIKTGDDKVAVVLEDEKKVKIPEGYHGEVICSHHHARHYSDGGYQFCFACRKPFNGAWLRIVTLKGEDGKTVPCHTACVSGNTMIVKNDKQGQL